MNHNEEKSFRYSTFVKLIIKPLHAFYNYNLTQAPYSPASEFAFVLHPVGSPKDPVPVKPSLHKLSFIPACNKKWKFKPILSRSVPSIKAMQKNKIVKCWGAEGARKAPIRRSKSFFLTVRRQENSLFQAPSTSRFRNLRRIEYRQAGTNNLNRAFDPFDSSPRRI